MSKVITSPRQGGKTHNLAQHILETGGEWIVVGASEALARLVLDRVERLDQSEGRRTRSQYLTKRTRARAIGIGAHRVAGHPHNTKFAIDNAHNFSPLELIKFGAMYGEPDVITWSKR